MLFLDTCTVRASYSVFNHFSVTKNITTNADTTWINYDTTASPLIAPVVSTVSGADVFRVPFSYIFDVSSLDNASQDNYYVLSLGNLSFTCSGGNYNSDSIAWIDSQNVCFGTGPSLSNWVYNRTEKGASLITWINPWQINVVLWVEVPVSFVKYVNGSSGDARNNFSFTVSGDVNVRPASNAEVESAKVQTSDSQVQQNTSSIAETSEDTNSKITDFFGSFFDNLLHIFVPEDGYFSTWFVKVNTLLSDKLGMLYAPFDLVISTLQAIYSSSTTESGIPFPGIKWEDTWLVEPFSFTFASLGSDFDDLRDKVYFATDTVLVLTFLMLLQSKVKLILEGHE